MTVDEYDHVKHWMDPYTQESFHHPKNFKDQKYFFVIVYSAELKYGFTSLYEDIRVLIWLNKPYNFHYKVLQQNLHTKELTLCHKFCFSKSYIL